MAAPGQILEGSYGTAQLAAQGQRDRSSVKGNPETVVLGQPKSISMQGNPSEVVKEGKKDSSLQPRENVAKSAISSVAEDGDQKGENVAIMQKQGSGTELKDVKREKAPVMESDPLKTSGKSDSGNTLKSDSEQAQQEREEVKSPLPAEQVRGETESLLDHEYSELLQQYESQINDGGVKSKGDPDLLRKNMFLELQGLRRSIVSPSLKVGSPDNP